MKYLTIKNVIILALMLNLSIVAKGVLAEGYLLESATQVADMRIALKHDGAFLQEFKAQQRTMDIIIAQPFVVPQPTDAGGGYSHEVHKKNSQNLRSAGRLYLLSGKGKYRDYARDMLLAYAKLYPSLSLHPKHKDQSPGKLFWQSLNEAVWLVYSIQGYDAIKNELSAADRAQIEQGLFVPMATFLSQESPQTFNKIHNHGTWATAAVGMTGIVLGNNEWVEQALYGLDKSGAGGFMRQLDELFSPDGYYNEGPYYQRYALLPFVIFAKAIEVNQPQRHIFQYRDSIILKAINTTIQLSYNGLFFGINDAIKDKGLDTIELVNAVTIAYGLTQDAGLLSIAKKQHNILLTADGLLVANALDKGLAQPYAFISQLLRDGTQGDEGALVILRSTPSDSSTTLVFKPTAQGLGHGHFDKLNWLFFDAGLEIITDYGAARFLNVEAKYGGHYLPENNTYAKQTIAHNTLVVDETSHFKGNVKTGNAHHPELHYFEQKGPLQIVAAAMSDAYDDVQFSRTQALVTLANQPPFVIDVLKVKAKQAHQLDLPFHYNGHFISTNADLHSHTSTLKPLGKSEGYQHLWLKAQGRTDADLARITWLTNKKFYTLSTVNTAAQELLFTQLGANDPNVNLRSENAVILRLPKASEHSFVSILEPHGEYNPAQEFTLNSQSQLQFLTHIELDKVDVIRFQFAGQIPMLLALSKAKVASQTKTEFEYLGQPYNISGNAELLTIKEVL